VLQQGDQVRPWFEDDSTNRIAKGFTPFSSFAWNIWNKASFRCENFLDFVIIALLFVCAKYYLDLSRALHTNCVISFYFRLYLMLHACAARFDVTENLENFLVFF